MVSISSFLSHLSVLSLSLLLTILAFFVVVLGSAFLWGGLQHVEQTVSLAVSESNADMLAFSVFSLSIPALFSLVFPDIPGRAQVEEKLSLVTSVCLLLIYCLFMFFQLHTHEYLNEEAGDIEAGGSPGRPLLSSERWGVNESEESVEVSEDGADSEDEEEDAVPSLQFSAIILVTTVITVAGLSELLVASIGDFSAHAGLGEKFIAIVLLPVIGNAVEHMSAILVAGHNKIDLSIGIACGSSVQIALFVAPMLVLISWGLNWKELTLNFHIFDTMCIGFSVFVVNVMLRDTNSNWLKGMVLIGCYFIVSAAFFFVT